MSTIPADGPTRAQRLHRQARADRPLVPRLVVQRGPVCTSSPTVRPTEVPVPADLDFDAWQGPSPMVPVHRGSRDELGRIPLSRNLAGLHCRLRHPRTGTGPMGQQERSHQPDPLCRHRQRAQEGIFRTLERWDVTCDYANGVKLRFMDFRTATAVVMRVSPQLASQRRPDLSRQRGLDQRRGRLLRQQPKALETEVQAQRRTTPVSPEHNRNFIDCVKSRQETMCPVEMAIRCDDDLPVGEHRGTDGPRDPMGPGTREDRQRRGGCEDARPAVPREMESVVNHDTNNGTNGNSCAVRFCNTPPRSWLAPGWPTRVPRG